MVSLRSVAGCRRLVAVGAALSFAPAVASSQVDPLGDAEVPVLHREVLGRIGGWDERPEYELTRVRGAAVLSSGAIALTEGMTRQLRVYSARGEFVRSMGGEGDGPGEFRAIRDVVALEGDRLLVWDVQRRRVTVFATDGELVDTWLPDGQGADLTFPEFVGATPDGRVTMRSTSTAMFLRDEDPGMRRDPVIFVTFAWGGELEGAPVSIPGPERLFYRQDRAWGSDRLLLGRELVAAVTHRGLVVALTDSLHLRLFDGTGEGRPYLRVHRPPRPSTREIVEGERAWRVADVEARAQGPSPPGAPVNLRRELAEIELSRLAEMDHEPTIPAFGTVLAAADGGLLISDYLDASSGVRRWFVWDANLNLVGRIGLPLHERLLAAGHGLLVTVEEDDLGLETVTVYGLSGG